MSCSTSPKCSEVWMTKNLDVSTYRNGDTIPQVTDDKQWASLSTGAWCYYNNDSARGKIYGKLYNFYAVRDPRGLAPTGYHMPSDAEWTSLETSLETFLGLSHPGDALKEAGTKNWHSPNSGATNSSGFSGLPGGSRTYLGNFEDIGTSGKWWRTNKDDTSFSSMQLSLLWC